MINYFLSKHPRFHLIFQIIIAAFSSLIFGLSLNFFLIPGNIFSAGVTGLAQIVNYYTESTPLGNILTTGNLFFILNIPILILAFYKLGREFTFLTVLVVMFSSFATNMFPVTYVSHEPLVNAIVGGALSGFAAGVTMRFGMSGGGFDIISIVLARQFGINVGFMSLLANLLIVLGSGLIYNWETAIFTVITIFVSSRLIDTVHTGEQRLTAFIVTKEVQAVTDNISNRLYRGSTIIEGRGGFTGQKRDMVMVVINRYEFHDLQLAIAEADSHAFINIMQSSKVFGQFLTRDQQKFLKTQSTMQSK